VCECVSKFELIAGMGRAIPFAALRIKRRTNEQKFSCDSAAFLALCAGCQ